YNRGVEKRDIFVDDKDYLRFIHDLYEFNDKNPVFNLNFRLKSNYRDPTSIVEKERKKRKLLVEILCFCLMPNHFHLILKQVAENGIPLFMQKLGGYAYYFNSKYRRIGPLFQGRFKAIQIDNENYLLHLSRYIHLNPIEIVEPKWKEKKVINLQKINKFLKSYRWSSYLDYIGIKNFPSVTQRQLINSYFKTPKDYRNFIIKFLPKDLSKIEDLIIEK
ncbi:MAG: transposase, partial [Patescibacteria group bacterium]